MPTSGAGKTQPLAQSEGPLAKRPPIIPGHAGPTRGFLDAFEIPPERIPVNLDAQAALYRSLLADRKVLLVLDNARDSEPGPSPAAGQLRLSGRDHQPQPVGQPGHAGGRPPDHPGCAER